MSKKKSNKKALFVILMNFVGILATTVVLILLTLAFLRVYTRHGQSVVVPQLEGLQVTEAKTILRAQGLRLKVLDSIYQRNAIPGAIIDQTPNANNRVKEGRSIYITVFAQNPRQVVVPDLVNYSVRHATAMLNSLQFNQLTIEEVPSEFAGIVLGVQYRGRTLTEGESVPAGSALRLIVGRGGAPPISPELFNNEEVVPQAQGIDNTFN